MKSKIPTLFWFFTFGFFFNNCAFNVLAQLQSSINPTVGSVSVAISYITSTFVCLILVPILFKATSMSTTFSYLCRLKYAFYRNAHYNLYNYFPVEFVN